MGHLDLFYQGLVNSLTTLNLAACFIGALIGTIIGVLPGLGATATLTLLLPFTLRFPPETGLIMMAGVWFGSMYGGSITSIMVNIPGEAASVVTCIDGYQMAKKGRGGAALFISAVGSWIAGTIGIIGLQIFGPALGNAALSFGPPEYLAFMIFAFVMLSNLASESPLKGMLMIGLGLFISTIGLNPIDSFSRFTFGSEELMMGIDFLPIAMGFFGIAEILNIALESYKKPEILKIRFRDLYPQKEELKRSTGPVFRGSILGFFIGLLPGPCTIISTFISYSLEKRMSKRAEEFGKGAIEGVAGPESANNSAVLGSMIPLLTLGIPFAAPSAIMLAGLRMHDIEPGPLLFTQKPDLFWTFIAAMYVGNIMLLILNLPLVGVFGKISQIPPKWLMPFVAIICLVGVYSVRNSIFDVWVMIFSGIIGYFMRSKWKLPIAAFIIGVVLGPTTENNFRQTLMMYRGDLALIFKEPIAVAFLSLTIAFALFKISYPFFRKRFKGFKWTAPTEPEE
jgi:putative tricarboxylic transport membrane protein